MTEWVMIIITTIYVFATIVICYFNGKTAKTAKIQTDEMIRQYELVNKPYVMIHFDIIRSGLLCFVIENEGSSPAHNVNIKINKEFIDGVGNENEKERLERLADTELYLASKQRIFLFLGGQSSFKELAKNVAEIDIQYDEYKEHTTIDLNQYGMFLKYASPMDDISEHIKKIKENDEKFQKSILKQLEKNNYIQNVVIHNETEDEANKFKIFKLVCCEQNMTVNIISEKMKLDKEYILQLLIELERVDKLVEYFADFDENDYEVKWHRR